MEKHNHMTILYILPGSKKEKYGAGKKCICRCDCGRLFKRPYRNILSGKLKMCKKCSNQLRKQQIHHTTHDKTHTRLYKIYYGIKNRCYNKNQEGYKKWYGFKNIIMCDEWKNDFLSFYNWAINNGYQENLSIDRIDNDGNYCPENCRWVTKHIQAVNQKISKNNKTGYVGIYKSVPKSYKTDKIFIAQISVNNKKYFLGRFKTIESALKARNEFIEKNNLKEYKIQ